LSRESCLRGHGKRPPSAWSDEAWRKAVRERRGLPNQPPFMSPSNAGARTRRPMRLGLRSSLIGRRTPARVSPNYRPQGLQ
jgi:hypothetical protein